MKHICSLCRKYCRVKLMILLMLCMCIPFLNYAYAGEDISIPVWSDALTERELILHKDGLSDKIEITDDELLNYLEEKEPAEKAKIEQAIADEEKEIMKLGDPDNDSLELRNEIYEELEKIFT